MPDAEEVGATRTRELASLCTHLQNNVEREKAELARRLHDELGGLLTAAKMDLSWVQSRLEDPVLHQRITQLGNVLDEAMDLKRLVVDELRPSLLDHFGLPTALRTHVESVCAHAGIDCEVAMEDEIEMESLPRERAIGVFRVIQAGLDNILRHAAAKKVRIEISSDSAWHLLRLLDNGRGMDLSTPAPRSHGLAGMRHRVEAMGGKFTLESSPDRGTTLIIAVPRSA